MSKIYDDYSDSVSFIAIDVDHGESADVIRSYQRRNGYTWPMIEADSATLSNYQITRQASKVVLDADGIILKRDLYGGDSQDDWRELLNSLSGS